MTMDIAQELQDSVRRRQAIDAWAKNEHATDDVKQEARSFLSILEQRVTELTQSSDFLDRKMEHVQLDNYIHFRDIMSQCWTFSILIENRIARLHDDSVPELIDKFESLTVAIWSVLLRGALQFFKALADEEYLPLGSREVFMRELKTLYDADNLLRQERYFKRVSEETMDCLGKSEKILLEIIERAPKLLLIYR